MSKFNRVASVALISLFAVAISTAIAEARHGGRGGGGGGGYSGGAGVRSGGLGGGAAVRGGFSGGGYRSGIGVQPRFGGSGIRSGGAVQPQLGGTGYGSGFSVRPGFRDGGYRAGIAGGARTGSVHRRADRHRPGWDRRPRRRGGTYFYYFDDWGYEPWYAWEVPLYAYEEDEYYEVPVDDEAIAECKRRFRSYDPLSRTYLGTDGRRHRCP
jgi:hypothetical protein